MKLKIAKVRIPTALEETDESGNLGVEREDIGDGLGNIVNPWDPSKIRVDPKMFSLKNILDMIDAGELELAPGFQRRKVWKLPQKARLIESILLRIPLPAFYFSANEDGSLQVVDGLQRLSTVHDFVEGEFGLDELEYLQKEVGDKYFKDIEGSVWGRRINSTQISVNVIDPQTPDQVKFDIFKRINTGGSPLNSQEIRHCMSKARSRDFLKSCADSRAFTKATGEKLLDHPRMVDREMVLRFAAFKMKPSTKDYSAAGTMDAFLTDATRAIDKDISDEALRSLEKDFETAMNNATHLFGDRAFRKWPDGVDKIFPINRALFEAWAVPLASWDWMDLKSHRETIVQSARGLMTNDPDFINAISTSTGDPRRVDVRFSRVKHILGKYR